MEWCTIESDPGVFEEMIARLGAKGVRVQEIYGLEYDEELYKSLNPVYGFVFLFKWVHKKNAPESQPFNGSQIFFAKQVVTDACATQAILSVLLNNEKEISLGENLTDFRNFCIDLDPYSRGLSIGDSEFIRSTHNSFGVQKAFQVVSAANSKKEDAFHFIAYILHENKVIELDGLQESAMVVKDAANAENWHQIVLEHIRDKVKSYDQNEIRFSLLAIVADRSRAIGKKVEELTQKISKLKTEGRTGEVEEIEIQLADLQNTLNIRENELKNQRAENMRRRHNYVPLIFSLLDTAAKAGKLEKLLSEAYARAEDKK